MNGYAAQGRELVDPGCFYDGAVRPHTNRMHYAHAQSKRLLHTARCYSDVMSSTPNERLRAARKKFFAKPGEAADALSIPRGTYYGHENGHRGFPAERAPEYARRFKVSEEWLLYGKGEPDVDDPIPSVADLEKMVRLAIDEGVDMQTRLADLPRVVAPTMRALLEQYIADRLAWESIQGGSTLLGDDQPPQSTTPGA